MAHFYVQTENGVEPRHFVPMASRPDELRPTRITDVRKMWKAGEVVVPSVTTILSILDKPALKNWLIDQHLQQAHTLVADYVQTGSVPDVGTFINQSKHRAEQEMSKAPDAGTDIHKVLEDYMLTGKKRKGFEGICENVDLEISRHCGDLSWECEKYFMNEEFGFGGCVDLVGDWVIDYKTKQTADKFKPGKMAYPEHSRQLAAYRAGLETPKARAANIFICIETGEVDFHEHTEEQLAQGWEVFRRALEIWQITNGYKGMNNGKTL